MRRASYVGYMAAALIAASTGLALPAVREARQPVKPEPRTQARLTKAEKKRARKAAQRMRLGKRGAP